MRPVSPSSARQLVVLLLILLLVVAHVARTLLPPEQSLAWINQYAFIPARYSPAFLSQHGIDGGSLHRPWPSLLHLYGAAQRLHPSGDQLPVAAGLRADRGAPLRAGPVPALLYNLRRGGRGDASGLQLGLAGAGDRRLGRHIRPDGGGHAAAADRAPALGGGGPPGEAAMLPIWSRQIILFTLIWVALNVVAGFTGLGMAGEVGLIAWQAHLGGYAAGLMLSGPFDALRPQTVGQPL